MDFTRSREILVRSLGLQIKDERVLRAFARVHRELFVPPELEPYAYDDRPLAIGHGQTISQPYIVAVMVEALELSEQDRVLEIGTGSGYEAAILAEVAGSVYSTERIRELGEVAKSLLEKRGYDNISINIGGDELGWKEHAPFDAIVVSAAAPSISDVILSQLKIGGRLVIPVGSRWEQELLKVTKGISGNSIRNLGAVRFVPLIGKEAWQE